MKKLREMVGLVKRDEEVAIRYMRLWEEKEKIRREALEEGRVEGREEERANTEKEKARADEAEARASEAERKCAELQAILDGRNV